MPNEGEPDCIGRYPTGPLNRYYVIIALSTRAARVPGTVPSFIVPVLFILSIDTRNSIKTINGLW
jgi:hypothetical protein